MIRVTFCHMSQVSQSCTPRSTVCVTLRSRYEPKRGVTPSHHASRCSTPKHCERPPIRRDSSKDLRGRAYATGSADTNAGTTGLSYLRTPRAQKSQSHNRFRGIGKTARTLARGFASIPASRPICVAHTRGVAHAFEFGSFRCIVHVATLRGQKNSTSKRETARDRWFLVS